MLKTKIKSISAACTQQLRHGKSVWLSFNHRERDKARTFNKLLIAQSVVLLVVFLLLINNKDLSLIENQYYSIFM